MDVILPIPSNFDTRNEISKYVQNIIDSKTENRKKIHNLNIKFM